MILAGCPAIIQPNTSPKPFIERHVAGRREKKVTRVPAYLPPPMEEVCNNSVSCPLVESYDPSTAKISENNSPEVDIRSRI